MMLFFFFPNPLTYVLAVMLIGARQLGLAVIMHDALIMLYPVIMILMIFK